MIAEQKQYLVSVMQGTRIFVVMTCCCVCPSLPGYYYVTAAATATPVSFSFFIDRWQTMKQTTINGCGKREAEDYNYESSISLYVNPHSKQLMIDPSS